MFRTPIAWLVRRYPSALIAVNRLGTRWFRTYIQLRFRAPVAHREQLAAHLFRVASSPWSHPLVIAAAVAFNLETHDLAAVEKSAREAVNRLCATDSRAASKLFIGTLRGLANQVGFERSAAWAETCLPSVAGNSAAVRALSAIYQRSGAIERPLQLLDSLDGIDGKARRSRQYTRLRGQKQLLRSGVAFAHPHGRVWTPRPRRVLYYASQSLPHHSSGYAIRTHWLVHALNQKNWDVTVQTRLGYPNDRADFVGAATVAATAEIDGVSYHFTPDRKRGFAALDVPSYQAESVATLVRHAERHRPAIIHCASNYQCGLAGVEAACALAIPSIYEVRGLWHMTRGAEQPEYLDSDHFRLIQKLEVQAAASADHVFAITDAVKQILVRDGVPADSITILPNAVDTSRFVPRARNRALAQKWRVEGKRVIGYIGTLKDYEGLDYLLEAAALLRGRVGDEFCVLLVGDGPARVELTSLCKRLELQDIVRFVGRAPHAEIRDYYSLIDITAFPRRGLPVCEVVSPLKPFEAMATAKAVVASNVAALAEMVQPGETGLLHQKDDVESLCDQLERCLTEPGLTDRLGSTAREWVATHRSWSAIARRVDEVYRRLL